MILTDRPDSERLADERLEALFAALPKEFRDEMQQLWESIPGIDKIPTD
jgi:hypothetical protein